MIGPVPLADADLDRLLHRGERTDADLRDQVAEIMQDVRAGGDDALRRWTRTLDGADLPDPFLGESEWRDGAAECPAEVRVAIDAACSRIRSFHELQAVGEQTLEPLPGLRLGRRPVPYAGVACYAPGGTARYPSSVLMTVVAARIAGVARILLVTPPDAGGRVDPSVLYAAQAAGATRVLRAGGAQAVAALAWGTTRIQPVDAIVGPGNAYVTEAKRQAARRVHVDAEAGPSELLVVADAVADPDRIALDLVAQAEHDADARVVLVATDAALADRVAARLAHHATHAGRHAIVQASLDHAALLVASDLDEALRFSDRYAPEHLSLQVADPEAALGHVQHAGSVFLGPHTPVALGDYGCGTNHVLPTRGQARLRGGLCVDDFRKWITWQRADADALAALAPDVRTLARAEGLPAHGASVRPGAAADPQAEPPREPGASGVVRGSRTEGSPGSGSRSGTAGASGSGSDRSAQGSRGSGEGERGGGRDAAR